MKGAAVLKRIRKPLVSLLLAAVLACALFALSSAAGLFGDIDGDGGVTYEDAQLLFRLRCGAGRLTVSQLSAADINRDGQRHHRRCGDALSLRFRACSPRCRLRKESMRGWPCIRCPKKSNTLPGEAFDYSGLVICAVYDGGKRVPLEDYSLSVLGSSSPGVKIVRVTAGGLQTAFTLTVLPDTLTGIELTSLPAKRSYVVGESLDLSGLRVNALYASGTSSSITAYAVDGFDGSRTGTQSVTVFYRGFSETFTVTVGTASGATVNTGSSALNLRSAPRRRLKF